MKRAPEPTSRLLILGASVRAAAQSAWRAGLRPIGIDLFADRDLAALGPAHRIAASDYPHGLAARAAKVELAPWIYTGALENHPDRIDHLARQRPLWGCRGESLRAVRDPLALARILRAAGLASPEARRDPDGLPRDGRWLVKPWASAGGRGIQPLLPDTGPPQRPSYYHERIEGEPLSAVYVAQPSGTTVLGVTWQWIGLPEAPFAYRGSIGPWPLSAIERARFETLGQILADAFGLIGLFGVDLIWREGQPWAVEVNPRYTASIEVLELALGRSFLGEHRRAFDSTAIDCRSVVSNPRAGVVGKAILFARSPCRFPDLDLAPSAADPFAIPTIADIPHPGATFGPGDPVLTVFAHAENRAACRSALEQALRCWEARLISSGSSL
jgi:predicted ATP-grasp superfamily ATP-dependent carboligase